MEQTVQRKPRGMHYTPHQATMNAMACNICGIKAITEAEWLEADLAANVDKAAKANQRDEAAALAMQIQTQEKVGAL